MRQIPTPVGIVAVFLIVGGLFMPAIGKGKQLVTGGPPKTFGERASLCHPPSNIPHSLIMLRLFLTGEEATHRYMAVKTGCSTNGSAPARASRGPSRADLLERTRRKIAGAPDAALIALIATQRELLARYETDPKTCGRLIKFGISVLPGEEQERYVDSRVAATRAATRAAGKAGVERAEASDAEWEQVLGSFEEAGYRTDMLDSRRIRGGMENDALCDHMLAWFDHLLEADFDGASRVRAEAVFGILDG